MPYRRIEVTLRIVGKGNDTPTIENTNTAVSVLRNIFSKNKLLFVEHLYLLCLDANNRLMNYCLVSMGGLSASIVDLNVINLLAAQKFARQVILAHNHPSGSLYPSAADITSTAAVRESLSKMNIHLKDHIIITENYHLSMKDTGLF